MPSVDPVSMPHSRPRVGPDLVAARHEMVDLQLAARGIQDPAVLDAMRTVPREAFVPPHLIECAYDDGPLPIGEGQTISQPYVVAFMIAAVSPAVTHRALEIGTGSGYSAAVLASIVKEVYTIERLSPLADTAARRLADLGYRNVHVRCGDGTLGWPDQAPYDVIIVTAGGPRVPPALIAQLAVGGRLVMPVGSDPSFQQLVRLRRQADGEIVEDQLEPVAFVPLIGAEGWPEPQPEQRTTPPHRPG
jgi:protein-L-isoaspartate(D-aspartate) O-methyltransferase